MRPIFRFYKTYELLNLGAYSNVSRLHRLGSLKNANRPPPGPPVFGPNLGVFDPPPGGGSKSEKNVKFRQFRGSRTPPRTPEKHEKPDLGGLPAQLFSGFFRNFAKFSEISRNFPKFPKSGGTPPKTPKTPNSGTAPLPGVEVAVGRCVASRV